jgi:hypothetical protein
MAAAPPSSTAMDFNDPFFLHPHESLASNFVPIPFLGKITINGLGPCFALFVAKRRCHLWMEASSALLDLMQNFLLWIDVTPWCYLG